MARTLFLMAYADAVERGEVRGKVPRAGQDWDSAAPKKTPSRFIYDAFRLIGRIEQMNGSSIICLLYKAAAADGHDVYNQNFDVVPNRESYAQDFGHCLAMQSLGSGVGWFDDHNSFELKLPYIESHLN